MLWNIVDHRTNKYCVKVDAVFEPAFHDNSIPGASQADADPSWDIFAVYNTVISEVIEQANTKWTTPVTVYLYDANSKPLAKT